MSINNTSLTNSVTALGQTFPISTDGMNSVTVEVHGTFVADLQFQVTLDGSTWFSCYGISNSTLNQINSVNSPDQVTFNVAAVQQFQVWCDSYTSGTAIVSIVSSAGPSGQVSPLTASAGTTGAFPTFSAGGIINANQGGAAGLSFAWPMKITDGTSIAQVISGALSVNASGSSVKLEDSAGSSVTIGQKLAANSLPVVLASDIDVKADIHDSAGSSITVGQKTMSSSVPVTLASDQSPMPATQSGTWTVTAKLEDGSGSPINKGQATMAFSLPVTLASDQSPLFSEQYGTWTVQPGNTANLTPWLMKLGDGSNTMTVKASGVSSTGTDTSVVVAVNPNTPVNSAQQGAWAVSLGNTGGTSGKSTIATSNSLTTTATTADQVICSYTVSASKTFYLQAITMEAGLTTLSGTAKILGKMSFNASGGNFCTHNFNNSTNESVDKASAYMFAEPVPFSSGTVLKLICTPNSATSTFWQGNFIGYEK